jgi:hypothetical protein
LIDFGESENESRMELEMAQECHSPLLSCVACMHTPVVLLAVLNICKSAVLVRSLVSNQLHLDMERLRLRLLDWS